MFRRKKRITNAERLVQIDEHLHDVLKQLTYIRTQGRKIMAMNAELKAFLDEANTYTNDIAKDIDELLERVKAGQPLSDEDRAAMAATADTLRNVAAKHSDPLPAPVEP